jgi:hypothetical protein
MGLDKAGGKSFQKISQIMIFSPALRSRAEALHRGHTGARHGAGPARGFGVDKTARIPYASFYRREIFGPSR